MKKVIFLLLCVAISSLGLFVQVSDAGAKAPDASSVPAAVNNSVSGFVFTETRQPLNNVYVELLSDIYTTVSRTKTTGAGFYSFRALPPGNYKVKVLPYGTDYEEQMRSVSLVPISAIPGSGGISEQVDFYLKPRKTNDGPLGSPGVIFAQEVPGNAKKLYQEGIEFLEDKKEQQGFDLLKKALEIFPDYFLALDRLGTEYVVRGYYRPAYVLLSRAVEINPRSYSSMFGLGLAQYHLKQYEAAAKTLEGATRLFDRSINSFLWLGISLHHNGKLAQAEDALIQANKLSNGESAEVHWQLARLYSTQKQYFKAADELELFLKYNPQAENAEKVRQTIQQLREKKSTQ